jgi:mannose-6-phosphate isomerase-like protein (cupin superfamily)
MPYSFSIEEAIEKLGKETSQRFTLLLKHGTMSIEYYAPKDRDLQTPHMQDEIYVITSGSAIFNRDGEKQACRQGDILFVPAAMKHHFEQFSDDFATWVIFYGPQGGERVTRNF